ncbi:MAG: hypothetical protein WAQ07_03325 [Candidatus Omnitrophota bacterium]
MKEGVLFTLFLIALTSICDTINQLFLKSAINTLDTASGGVVKIFKFIFKLIAIPRVWLSFIFSVISLCIWLLVLSRADLSFAFSADSMHYIFIALVSRLFLREKVCFKRWLGVIFIAIGITIISLTH